MNNVDIRLPLSAFESGAETVRREVQTIWKSVEQQQLRIAKLEGSLGTLQMAEARIRELEARLHKSDRRWTNRSMGGVERALIGSQEDCQLLARKLEIAENALKEVKANIGTDPWSVANRDLVLVREALSAIAALDKDNRT